MMNVKRRRFAQLAAQGVALAHAYDEVYGKGEGSRQARYVTASKMAKDPDVRAAIEQYEAQALPPIADLRALKQEMLANIRELARNSPDQKVRLAASMDLRNYIEERERKEELLRDRQPITIDGLIREVQALAAPAERPVIELETVEESPQEAAQAFPGVDPSDEPGGAILGRSTSPAQVIPNPTHDKH